MAKIILASKSPRRTEIMRRYCSDLEIILPDVNEEILPEDRPDTAVLRLSFEKAQEAAKMCSGTGIVLAADTIVYLDKIMGKPKNREEARLMLKELSNKTHFVYTGINLIKPSLGIKASGFEVTEVDFNDLSDDEIEKYLDTGEYADKAGAYGIQGYGELFVKGIRGCYNNVKGLPVAKLNYMLKKYFNEGLM